MLADPQILEDIVVKANQLSPEYRLRLIQRVTATLLPFPPKDSIPLQFGKYPGDKMSNLADFAIAEWHPEDDNLYGK